MRYRNVYFSWRHTPKKRRTECFITETVKGQQVTTLVGTTRCHSRDVYSKETGRRAALTQALKTLMFGRVERTEVWETYRTLSKEPKWKKREPKRVDAVKHELSKEGV
jgi:hypothetical protein